MEALLTVRDMAQKYLAGVKVPQSVLRLAESTVGAECTKKILVNCQLEDTACLRLFLSKGLGLGIIAGSAVVKVPQILKVLAAGSAEGLSMLALLIESVALCITLAYNVRASNPFTTFGETLFIAVQNVLMLLLMLALAKSKSARIVGIPLILAGVGALVAALLSPQHINEGMMAGLFAMTIPLTAASRIPQILKTARSGHTGQLSFITVTLVCLGSQARVFTTVQELQDRLLLSGVIVAAALNTIIAAQMIYYWNSRPAQKTKSD